MKNQAEVNYEFKLRVHVEKRLEAERRAELHKTISEFYGQAGLFVPVDKLLDHI